MKLFQRLRHVIARMTGATGTISFFLGPKDNAHGSIWIASNPTLGTQLPVRFSCEFPYGLHDETMLSNVRQEIIHQAMLAGLEPLSFTIYHPDHGLLNGRDYIVTQQERSRIFK